MALLKYIGSSHYRELFKSDFAKAGVEVEKAITFARHEIVEVADDVAEAIHNLVGDEFEKVEDDVDKELVRNAAEDPQPTSAVPGTFIPQATEPDETSDVVQPMPAPTPSEQPPSEVEGTQA
jgi:hypothetical protein